MKRKLITFVLAVLLLCSAAIPVSAALKTNPRNSVAFIATFMDTELGSFGQDRGTGFFVNDQYLVTNWHVIQYFINNGEGQLRTDLAVNGVPTTGRAKIRVYFDSSNYSEAYLVGYDKPRDIAIIRLDAPTKERTPLKLLIPTDDMVGSDIYAVGYPGMADNIFAAATGEWGINDASVTSGTFGRLFTQAGTGRREIQIDCNINGGNSGGPVVTEDGYVIGIATHTVSNSDQGSQPINYAVSIEDAILMLDQYKVTYTLASDPIPTDPIDPPQPPVPPEPEPTPWVIILISAAAVVIIAALVVIILMQRKNTKPAPVMPVGPAIPAAQPVIRSYSRANYGTAIRVSTQPVLIGRGGNCGLRFPDNTPGVSGSHCSVQWDPTTKDFIVTDLNSSYGTYLQSGQKMQPNQPYRMRSGDKFYLAEQSNTIGLSLE